MAISSFANFNAMRSSPTQRLTASKSALTTVAGRLYSLWLSTPDAGATPSTAVAPTRTTTGALLANGGNAMTNPATVHRIVGVRGTVGQPGKLIVIDRLSQNGGLSGTVVGLQATNLPTAALTRRTNGVGVGAALEIYSQIGTTLTTITATYTNEAGTTALVSPAMPWGGTAIREAGRFVPIPLLQGSNGFRAVDSVNAAASTTTAGNFGVTLFRRLLEIDCRDPGFLDFNPLLDAGGECPEIDADSCLGLLWYANQTTTGGIEMEILVAEDR